MNLKNIRFNERFLFVVCPCVVAALMLVNQIVPPELRWVNEQLDGSVHTFFAYMSLTTALFILLVWKYRKQNSHLLIVLGVFSTGGIDLLRAVVDAVPSQMWLRSVQIILNGLFFSTAWFLRKDLDSSRGGRLVTAAMGLFAAALILAIAIFPEWLPAPFNGDHTFSFPFVAIRLSGATLVFVAIFFHVRDKTAERTEIDSVLLAICYYSALVGFCYSWFRQWTPAWWGLMFLRMMPYLYALRLVINVYLSSREEVVVARNELKRAIKKLEHYATIISNDLQAPLKAVARRTQQLGKHPALERDPKAMEHVQFVLEETRQMEILIKGLLEYSQLDTVDLTSSRVDCAAVLKEAISHLTTEIRESEAQIRYGVLPQLPANRQLLIELFRHLLHNAIVFRRANPVIQISAHKEQGEWIFTIRDNGMGFKMKRAKRIFEVFQKIRSGGAGTGLATCKKIVELHGGRIWAESVVDQGSSFYFALPETVAPSLSREGKPSDDSQQAA